MRKTLTRIIAVLLCAVMFLQLSDGLAAFAAYEPTDSIALSVPETLQDGGNHFFIREDRFQISEKSHEKLYIPIQRAGAVEEPAEVTLKIADFTAHYGVNYTAKIRGEKIEPDVLYEGIAVVDIAKYADGIEEVEDPDENELGQAIHDAGGLDIVDTAGQTIGHLSADPVDENGEPIAGEAPAAPEAAAEAGEDAPAAAQEARSAAPGEVEEIEPEIIGADSPTGALRAARNAATGTPSDRQELETPEELLPGAQDEDAYEEADLAEDSYPGREYRLHFAAGETVKFLEITPKYSPDAEGDCILILMLKDEPLEYFIDGNFNDRPVVITDEDPWTPAVISMAAEETVAEKGSVSITVTRESRINETVGVMLNSSDGTAVQDEDYGGVGAKLYFPMGVMQRTVELPVGHGAVEKDFYVSITPLGDEQLGTAQTRVVIPAADAPDKDAELMAEGRQYTDPLNLKELCLDTQAIESYSYDGNERIYSTEYEGKFTNDGTTYWGRSYEDNVSSEYDILTYHYGAFILIKTNDFYDKTYLYDGISLKYDFFTNWAEGVFRVSDCQYKPGQGYYFEKNLYLKDWGDCSTKNGNVVDIRFGDLTAPDGLQFTAQNRENHYSWFRDCHVDMTIQSVQFIKRSFSVVIDPADPLPFAGVDRKMEKDRVKVMTDGTDDSILDLYALDTFTISKPVGQNYTRLKDVVAVTSTGRELSLSDYIVNNVEDGKAYTAGISDSFSVTLDHDLVKYLAENGCISWNRSEDSYSGSIHLKPVFDYSSLATVDVRESEFGSMYIGEIDEDVVESGAEPIPTLLWDFNSDNKMDSVMGKNCEQQVSWKGGMDADGNSYYTFTASGDDPYVSIDMSAATALSVAWVKVRARNLSGAEAIELFGHTGGRDLYGPECTHIDLKSDSEWHEYIIHIPTENIRTVNTYSGRHRISETSWNGKVDWIRLDPLWSKGTQAKNGDQIQIDYVAFFPAREDAEAFRIEPNAGPTLLWDFNNNGAMGADMGGKQKRNVNWEGGSEGDEEFYTFTATGNDPYVSIDNSAVNNVGLIQWVKVRARNLGSADMMQLYANMNGKTDGQSCTDIALKQDNEWHDYIINIPQENMNTTGLSATFWDSSIEWIRLDPMAVSGGGNIQSGDQIQIDYMAFFRTREEAEAFRRVLTFEDYKLIEPGTHKFHMGDRLVFLQPERMQGGMRACGVGYVGRIDGPAGEVYARRECEYYVNSMAPFLLETDYYQFWQVYTADDNTVRVRVPTDQMRYFDTDVGLFKDVTPVVSGGYTIFAVKENVKTNELMELTAAVKNANCVPAWTLGTERTKYSGQTFYFYTDVTAEENLVTLTADIEVGDHADYSLSGALYTATMNLATGFPADDRIPAAYSGVVMGPSAGSTDEEGKFTLRPQTLVGGTWVRYLISYNGITSVKETKIAPATAPTETVTYTGDLGSDETAEAIPVTVGAIRVQSNAAGGARFTSVEVEQVGVLQGILNVVELNGKELKVRLNVDPGGAYVYNDEVLTEQIRGVRLYFQNQRTGEIHGKYSTLPEDSEDFAAGSGSQSASLTWDPDRNIAVLNIKKLSPEVGGDCGAGDVLMAQLITDKRTFKTEISGQDMYYDPVSTGIAVISDREFEPETFQYELDIPTLLDVMVDDDGNLMEEEHRRNSFGRFPFLGEITAAIRVFTMFKGMGSDADYEAEDILDDLEEMDEGDLMFANPFLNRQVAVSALIRIKELPYGGQRIMFAVVATAAGGSYKSVLNPKATLNYLHDMYYGWGDNKEHYGNLIHKGNSDPHAYAKMQNEISGPYGRFSLYVGIYFDFGYVEQMTDDDRETHLDHNFIPVFMGAGGFIGGQAAIGWTWQFFPAGIPMYINIEGAVSAALYLGTSANPEMTLEAFGKTLNHVGTDFHFSAELKLQGSLSATGGLGLYKTIGIRLTLSIGVEAGYNRLMPIWYPLATSWGFTTSFTITGGGEIVRGPIRLSYDFGSFSWPLPLGYGFMQFAQQARRGTVLLTTLYTKIDDKNPGEEVKRTMWEKMIALGEAIDHYTVDENQLKRMVNDLRDYASDHGYLNAGERFFINSGTKNGIFFDIWTIVQCTDWEEFWHDLKQLWGKLFDDEEAALMAERLDDGRPSYGAAILAAADAYDQAAYDPNDDASACTVHVPAPVDSRWTANDGEMMAAFGAVSSKQLMEDAITSPNSQLMRLSYESGGVTRNSDQFLLVFLSEIENKTDGTHPDVLMYSIFDANSDTWTQPRQIQPDGIQDGKPCLVDAGDKLILTWSSVSVKNYSAFKAFAAEKNLSIEEAALQYPVEAGNGQEIFSVEFSKESKSFGVIEQLTDDRFDDSYPQAVYDGVSGDYIILYYKTAQDEELYDDPVQAILDTASASPDPEKTYCVLCYMIYNAREDKAGGYQDGSGTAVDVPAGWVRDHLYANEFDETMQYYRDPATGETTGLAGFLGDYGGQRFLPSPIPTQEDPPISDLTVCDGYNGLAAFAFTADTDNSLETSDDRDLFVQFYRFSDHSTYVPIKVAGEKTTQEPVLNGDMKTGHYESRNVTAEVNVGAPRLVRNGGSTWLFWREDGDSLKYLNISALLNYKVLDGEDAEVLARRQTNEDGGYYFSPEDQAALSREGSDHSVNAVRADGTFAIDAMTGKAYAPAVCTVDFGTGMTDPSIHITDYQVISDEKNDLYVVWSDTVRKDGNAAIVSCDESMALELYATAMVKEADPNPPDPENPTYRARWSKPYRLTRDNAFNDGMALALSDSGDLFIVHNQYRKLPIDTEEKLLELVASGEREVVTIDGEDYIKGSNCYDSPTSLMITRFAPVGSVEATQFVFSDDTPAAGQTVEVTAIIENTGLTTAWGYDVTFNECRNGAVTKRILSRSSDDPIDVNSAKKATFAWTVPDDGPEGYSIQAVISEKNGEGSYPPVTASSEPFVAAPAFQLTLESCVQNGDRFDASYIVANIGNKAAKEGTEANLYLQGLYGDLKEKYGVDDGCLIREDISGLMPGEVRTVSGSFTLPVSVFRYCGYDAVQAVVYDSSMNDLEHTDHLFVTLDEPLNLSLNGGKDVAVAVGSSVVAPAIYESTPFLSIGSRNAGEVVYTVADPAIAAVDGEGRVTGLSSGVTTLTATLLPSGRTKSVRLKVGDGCKQDDSCPISRFTDADPKAWYHDGVHWALAEGVMNGVGSDRFAPDSPTTRAMIVTMLHRMEGEPASDYTMTFQDVPAGQWYSEAIAWAAEHELVKGYSAGKFGPNDRLTREQLVTILERYARFKGMDVTEGEKTYLIGFSDAANISDWAVKAFRWAVQAGSINGVGNNRLSPATDATRAQVATMLMRFDAMPKNVPARRGREDPSLRQTK